MDLKKLMKQVKPALPYVVFAIVAYIVLMQLGYDVMSPLKDMVVKNEGEVDVNGEVSNDMVENDMVENDEEVDVPESSINETKNKIETSEVNPEDLLPKDDNLGFALSNPKGQGKLEDKNFLKAGYHIGINTIGQSLKNANYQLRSDPSIPRVPVSIFNNSTISADTTRRPLEIGESE